MPPPNSLSLSDLRNIFYGGGSSAEYAYMLAAQAAGITAVNILNVAQGILPPNSVGSTELAQVSGKSVLGKMSAGVGDVQEVPWVTFMANVNADVVGGGGGVSSPLTTKGDIWGFSTLNDRLPVGSNGKVLAADSAQALGLLWKTLTAADVGAATASDISTAITAHNAAVDPHGDRAFTTGAISTHSGAVDPHGDRAAASSDLTTGLAGKADLVGGLVPTSQIPAIAITDTTVVASQAAMLALTAQTGDVAVRSDINATFILSGTNPTILAHWTQLATPTDAVLSVNGSTGVVVLAKSDIGLSNVDNTSDATKNAAAVTLTNKNITTPTGIVKGDVGLGNVDNTSNATERAATATLTNKRITPRQSSNTSSATPTPNADTDDMYLLTAQAAAAAFAAPSGTPVGGQDLLIRIKDNGTARALTWNAIYRAIGVTLPTTTVISKTLYLGMKYNAVDSKWDVLAVGQEV